MSNDRTWAAIVFTVFLVPIVLMGISCTGPNKFADPAVVHVVFVVYLLACLAFMWGRASDV